MTDRLLPLSLFALAGAILVHSIAPAQAQAQSARNPSCTLIQVKAFSKKMSAALEYGLAAHATGEQVVVLPHTNSMNGTLVGWHVCSW